MSDYQPTPPPSTPYVASAYQPAPKSPVLSILAMVFGIVGVLGSFLYGLGILPAIAGVVLGFIGRRKEPSAKGFWLSGIITGFVGIVITIGWLILLAVVVTIGMHGGFSAYGS